MPTVKIMAMEKQNGALQKDYQNIEDISQAFFQQKQLYLMWG